MEQLKTWRFLWLAALILACGGGIGPKGDTGDPGPTGPQGVKGDPGHNSLVAVAPEAPGANCSGGGTSIRSGVDANDNGTLDGSEVAGTAYVCNGNVDPGTVVAFAGPAGKVPPGWFLCDGREVSRTGFVNLFNAIGVFHGIGNGTTTFNIPDYRGRFLRGVDYGIGRDPDRTTRTVIGAGTGVVSNEVGSIQGFGTARPVAASFTTDNPGNHSHTNGAFNRLLQVSGGTSSTLATADISPSEPDLVNSAAEISAGAHSHTVTGGGDSETRPQNAYVNYIIKT